MANLEKGYELLADFLTPEQLNCINHELASIDLAKNAGGIRNAEKKFESINQLAQSQQLHACAKHYLGAKPCLVRAIVFNKTPNNNWLVTWHQDKTIAVSKKFTSPKWQPWSLKDGVHHVQPPVDVLNQMITFRIHLDDTNESNGCLKVLPMPHPLSILSETEIQSVVQKTKPVYCAAKAGSALVMRPLVLHASSKATTPTQRRVLHLEYSSFQLPSGVFWG